VHDLPNKPLILQDFENKGDNLQDIQNAGVREKSRWFP
jgi:hypothetical protein